MIRLSKIILFFTAVVLLAWLLPWTYRFLTVRPDRTPFTLYSCVTESFASIDFNDGEIVRHDASGKTYTDREFDSILPLFYYRQLLSDGRQPDTLRGVALTPQTVSMQSFYFRNSPSDINKVKPELYPLLEAMSGRVELQMPPDVFRIHDRGGDAAAPTFGVPFQGGMPGLIRYRCCRALKRLLLLKRF